MSFVYNRFKTLAPNVAANEWATAIATIRREDSSIIASKPIMQAEVKMKYGEHVYCARDTTFDTVKSGETIKAIVISTPNGDPIAFIDEAHGMPMRAEGGRIQIWWDRGLYKVFQCKHVS